MGNFNVKIAAVKGFTKEEALEEAHKVAKLVETLEYGVVVIETEFKMYHD